MHDFHYVSDQLSGTTESAPLLLVVDDQPSNIQTLYAIFQDSYEVCMAVNGIEALAFCALRRPDLILLDVVMPGIGGYALCEALKQDSRNCDIPIIFVTGNADPLDEVQGFEVGGADFITKPFHATVVRARVQTQLTIKRQADLLRLLALVDGLTGVANRRQFDHVLDAEWRRCGRSGQPLSLLMIDVDHFKKYNDHYGHQQGDVCLRAIAGVIKATVRRPHDLTARYGGEEFACILPDTGRHGALTKAREIEQAIRKLALAHADAPEGIITVSIGVASVSRQDPGDSVASLVSAADAHLYRAKREGRGRVCCLPDQS
ncbi:diguanylate cyclase [Massilia sp. S19_KUP03_FR1]|uniref:diguanylate cyclase n=1 Tax=Massilia sp. S19_KUP03_FR1 TaxID=3025503 RepID=UPI002FCD9747